MAQKRGRALIRSMWKTVYVWEGPFLQDSEERGQSFHRHPFLSEAEFLTESDAHCYG